MSEQHTPEPWVVERQELKLSDGGLLYAFNVWSALALAERDHGKGFDELQPVARNLPEADAPRIVACVNGCKGIPDPEEAVHAMLEALERIAAEAVDGGESTANPHWAVVEGLARSALEKARGQ